MTRKSSMKKLFATISGVAFGLSCNIQKIFCTDLLDASQNGTESTLTYLCNLYRQWFLVFVFVDLMIWGIAKDDKIKEGSKKALLALIAIYVFSFATGLLTGTLDIIIGYYNLG